MRYIGGRVSYDNKKISSVGTEDPNPKYIPSVDDMLRRLDESGLDRIEYRGWVAFNEYRK